MLMKIGDVTNKFGISHRSLHYWEDAGILTSIRGDNGYRYYDDENTQRIKQIVFLRKLRLSIPSIHAIFTSDEMSRVIDVFSKHLNETKNEKKQLDALSTVLRQMINMMQDRQDITSVYNFLDTNHTVETEKLKSALQTVFADKKTVAISMPPEPVVDMSDIDLTLEPMTMEDVPEVTKVIKRCYKNTNEMDKLLFYFNFNDQLNMPGCAYYYKIMQSGECIGSVNLVYVGMEAMLIRCIAYGDADNNIYLFELLKQKHPDILCWNIYFPNEHENTIDHFCYDFENKKRQFADDIGFTFYTNARWDRYIKMLKPHDEVYNSSRYRFALLDGSMDGVSFRFFGTDKLDWYDGKMTNWRITDCDCGNALVYTSWLGNSKYYDNSFADSDFRFTDFVNSKFHHGCFRDCRFTDCDFTGVTVDGIDVSKALQFYKENSLDKM